MSNNYVTVVIFEGTGEGKKAKAETLFDIGNTSVGIDDIGNVILEATQKLFEPYLNKKL